MPIKEFHCGTLVPGCDWHTRHQDQAEIVRRAVAHLQETHGEAVIRERMIEAIKQCVKVASVAT